MIEGLNFSLASACSADCIFCPENRGSRISRKIMPEEVARKIIDEAASPHFKAKYCLKHLSFGENGDAFLNPSLIPILRYSRQRLPDAETYLFTNFNLFTPEKARTILGEKLVDHVCCNVDGDSEQGYNVMKRLDLPVVSENIRGFLAARAELKSPVSFEILAITYPQYVRAVRRVLGVMPAKAGKSGRLHIRDEFQAMKRRWQPLLDPSKDRIARLAATCWAERDQADVSAIEYRHYLCPNLYRVQREAFIAPDGTWYACCYDANNELVMGNAFTDGLDAVHEAAPRKTLIERLEKQDFGAIDGPCRTVNCCASIYDYKTEAVAEKIIGPKAVAAIKRSGPYKALRKMVKK